METTQHSMPLPADLISTRAAAAALGLVQTGTIIRWILKGRVRGWRIGGRWKVSRAEVLAVPKLAPAPPMTPASKAEMDADALYWKRRREALGIR